MSDKDYWERHARNYNSSLRWVQGRPLSPMLKLSSEAIRGMGKVLEVAAGTGIVTSAIAQTSDSVVAASVLYCVPNFPAALQALRNVIKPGGSLVVPTFCHDQTKASWLVSRLLAVSGFRGHRRFTLRSLRGALEDNGLQTVETELLPGLIFFKANPWLDPE